MTPEQLPYGPQEVYTIHFLSECGPICTNFSHSPNFQLLFTIIVNKISLVNTKFAK